ncbi:MAG TPA: hypothetical protein VM010_00205, partial [Chitinophagaceae bacterium]|nr:hypothetical protein [Chitinophagaceae bacterium]
MLFKKYIRPVWYALADYGTTALAWAFFYLIRKGLLHEEGTFGNVLGDDRFWLGVFLIPLGWLSLYAITGSYDHIYTKSRLAEFTKTCISCLVGTIVLFFLFLLDDVHNRPTYYYSAFVILAALNLLFTFAGRVIILRNAKQHIIKGIVRFNALIVGTAANANRIFRDNEFKLKNEGFDIKGFVPLQVSEKVMAQKLAPIGNLKNLEQTIDAFNIQLVILAIDKNETTLQESLIERLSEKDVAIKMQPSAIDILSGSVRASNVLGAVLIDLKTDLMPDWQQNIKRLIDIVFSFCALVVLFPVMLYIALRVRLSSPGSI